MLISPDIYFKTVFEWYYVLHNSLLHLLLKNCDFLNTDISHGSVATLLGCGGIFNDDFIANLLVSQQVKEFWKSVNIWRSYEQEFSGLFFWLTVYMMGAGAEMNQGEETWRKENGQGRRGRNLVKRSENLTEEDEARRVGKSGVGKATLVKLILNVSLINMNFSCATSSWYPTKLISRCSTVGDDHVTCTSSWVARWR